MPFVADLHIHSKYSRATSKDCDLEGLAWWGARKGISVIGTGDFTHPAWFAELQENLVPAEPGLYRLRPDIETAVLADLPLSCRRAVRFMLSVEISTIYKRDDRTRKVHHLIYMPDLASAEKFNTKLGAIGNIRSDGRPILGLDSRHLLEITLECGGYLIPAHIWTPWFAVLGSQSGFDAVDHCYGDLADHVFALETGLSSDPAMNWRVSSLDRYQLVSNSDAHSPQALGREATVFDTEIDYFAIRRALETGSGLASTYEFFPEEGKYHLDGHRKCNVCWEPAETIAHDNRCTGCGKPVTVGVLHRVDALADRDESAHAPRAVDFHSFVQLHQILGEIHGVGSKSKRVARDVTRLVDQFGPELDIVMQVPIDDISAGASTVLGEAIARLRRGEVMLEGGFDGEYGTVRLFAPGELQKVSGASVLFDVPIVQPTKSSAQPADALDAIAEPEIEDADISGVDEGQLAAIASLVGPTLIVAGPGTGKTHTITSRFMNLLSKQDVDPARCLAVTFTRRACDELRERLGEAGRDISVVTFHGLGLKIISEDPQRFGLTSEFRIATDLDLLEVAGGDLKNLAKAKRASIDDVEIVAAYNARLRACRLVDLDDLIRLPLQLLLKDPALREHWQQMYGWIAIDEFQDIDMLQYQLIKALTTPSSNICVVGDPDQAIYGFRGASVEHFAQFKADYANVTEVILTRNYRSSKAIVDASLQVVAPSSLVANRKLSPVNIDLAASPTLAIHEASDEVGEASFVSKTIDRLIGGTSLHSLDSGRADGTEGIHISFSDIAVLYRTDAQAEKLIDAFERSGIPAQKRSHERLLDHPGVAQLALQMRNTTQLDVIDALHACATDDVRDAVELLEPLAVRSGNDFERFFTDLSLGAEIDTWDARADRVSLLTMHASKGLEFPVVFVVGCNDGLIPLRWGSGDIEQAQLDEERRLLFVAMTRAKSHLVLTHARNRTRNGVVSQMKRSPFISDIKPSLLAFDVHEQQKRSSQLRLL